jgi:hypothetical protein
MHPHDPLLHDVLNEGGDPIMAAGSLDAMLSSVRRVRKERQIATAAGTVLGALILAAAISLTATRPPRGLVQDSRKHGSADSVASASGKENPPTIPVRKLTDEELFALFPDRQIALVGPPGDQRLLFLDAPRRQ